MCHSVTSTFDSHFRYHICYRIVNDYFTTSFKLLISDHDGFFSSIAHCLTCFRSLSFSCNSLIFLCCVMSSTIVSFSFVCRSDSIRGRTGFLCDRVHTSTVVAWSYRPPALLQCLQSSSLWHGRLDRGATALPWLRPARCSITKLQDEPPSNLTVRSFKVQQPSESAMISSYFQGPSIQVMVKMLNWANNG